jgi:ABC-type transporter Mla MlaB component
MLKISEAGLPNQSICLKLEGRVVGPWVEELRGICDRYLAGECSVTLDLSDVSYADTEGVAALNRYKASGVNLANCSPFLTQQIKSSN